MIVEYVDWGKQSGLGIRILNPTDQTLNLSYYTIFTLHNGSVNGGTSDQLSGMLLPNESIIVGNGKYCDDCPNECLTLTINGVDGNDVVGIKKSITYIDMVGSLGTDTQLEIDGNSEGLHRNRVLRDSDNCIRYFNLAGSPNNSWPDQSNINVTNWSNINVPSWDDSSGCLVNSSFNFEMCDSTATPPLPPDTTTIPVVKNLITIPNIITPNGDDMNDEFIIAGTDTSLVILNIYNRWGKGVYQQIDYKNDWNGEGLNDGTYYYKIVINNLTQYKGWIEVKR